MNIFSVGNLKSRKEELPVAWAALLNAGMIIRVLLRHLRSLSQRMSSMIRYCSYRCLNNRHCFHDHMNH